MKKNVVIVGGGFAGLAVATGLATKLDPSQHHIILIAPHSYAIPLPASLRLVVSEKAQLEHTALVPLDRLFKNGIGETRVGIVTSIEPKDSQSGGHVVLESGDRIPYEALVIASGSKWKGPIDFPLHERDVLPYVRSWRSKFASAKHVVIVGGGAVGIELAGELKDEYPDQRVTIVQGGDQLLNRTYSTALRKGLADRLRARGVELIFNEYVDSFPEEGAVGVVTRKGTLIPTADLVISARGPSPNTAFVSSSLGSSVLSDSGCIKVNATLQLSDYPRMFAVGDVIDWSEQKQAAKSYNHAAVVVKNVHSLLTGKSDPLAKYAGSPEMIIITNGRNGGMGYLPFFGGVTLGDFFSSMLKSRGLMVGKFRSSIGYK